MNINLLIDVLPEELLIDGVQYKIETDFTTIILLEQLLSDNTVPSSFKGEEMLNLIFPEEKPLLNDETAKQIEWFYRCGFVENEKRKEAIAKRNQKSRRLNEQVYDFEFDAPYIFAAFMQCYHIDLTETSMHWWKFKALFDSLDRECQFVKIMGYRSVDLNQVKDKSERKRMATLQTMYALPSKLSAEEKATRIGSMF